MDFARMRSLGVVGRGRYDLSPGSSPVPCPIVCEEACTSKTSYHSF